MTVWTRDIPDIDTKYARDISMPFQFDAECDLLMDEDQEVIDQSMNLITFIRSGVIRLFPTMGSGAMAAVFDQLDIYAETILDTSLRTAFEAQDPRVFLDKQFIFDETPDEGKVIIVVPYKIKVNGQLTATKLVIDRPGKP
jgi:hypothetical protein